jgi:hypothetical protein
MTPNRSLAISLSLRDILRTNLLGELDSYLPSEMISSFQTDFETSTRRRERIFTPQNTLLTMLATALHEDKSLSQSVLIFKEIYEIRSRELIQAEEAILQKEKEEYLLRAETGISKKRGRPPLFASKLTKTKLNEVSTNTAAFTKARGRLGKDLILKAFEYSADFGKLNGSKWHDMETFITDGTYFQMQDSEDLRQKYYVKHNDKAYPQGLLQVILRSGSGQVHAFNIGTRHQSELSLVKPLIGKMPVGSLLLADDLYSTYAIFCLMQEKGCHLIVPGKRQRRYTVIDQFQSGDEIVELPKTGKPDWIDQSEWDSFPSSLKMRRITYNPSGNPEIEYVLYTTLTEQEISKMDIVLKYSCRWEIEITIKEIKTIMGINIARSKTEEMVEKEIMVSLTAYNFIRRLIAKSVEETDFSPQSNFFQECFETNQNLLIDKKGRIYQRWSPGRYGSTNTVNKTKYNS